MVNTDRAIHAYIVAIRFERALSLNRGCLVTIGMLNWFDGVTASCHAYPSGGSMRAALRSLILLVAVSQAAPSLPAADKPGELAKEIDRLIEVALPKFASHASPTCSDAEFLRRVTLDLTATIPSIDRTREFLADLSLIHI